MPTPAFNPPEGFYERVEGAVQETARGRWFMNEHARRTKGADTDRVLTALQEMQAQLGRELASLQSDAIQRELRDMAQAIEHTRAEISALRPADADTNRIMMATEELDAIVTATERATSDILGAAERIQDVTAKLRAQGADAGLCGDVEMAAIDIFTACSFQDITGQRTNKVVKVLHYLENRINAMIGMWDGNAGHAAANPFEDMRPDAHLMNGPQREGEGVNQDDIDALLNGEFGALSEAAPVQAAPPPALARKAPPKAEEPEEPVAKASQADIDALFD